MRTSFTWLKWAVLASSIWLTGCGTISTLGKLESGAGSEASRMWDRWVEGEGDIACTRLKFAEGADRAAASQPD